MTEQFWSFKRLMFGLLAVLLASIASHPRAFGIAWYLTVLCGFISTIILFRDRTKQWQVFLELSKIWAIAVIPFVITSAFSVYYFNTNLGRAEILEVAIGGFGLIGLLCFLRPKIKFIFMSFSAAAFLAAGIAAYAIFYLGHSRAGIFFNPINLGIGSGLILIFLLWCSTNYVSRLSVWAIFFSALTLFLSNSRGPILAAFFSGIFFLLISRNIFLEIFPRLSGLLVLLIVISAGMVVLGLRFLQDSASEGSASSIGVRFQLWSEAASQILQTPLMGIGADQAGSFLSDLASPMKDFTHVHNTPLNIGLEQGLPGLIAWGWMFAVLARCTSSSRIGKNHFISLGQLLALYFFLCALDLKPPIST